MLGSFIVSFIVCLLRNKSREELWRIYLRRRDNGIFRSPVLYFQESNDENPTIVIKVETDQSRAVKYLRGRINSVWGPIGCEGQRRVSGGLSGSCFG